MKLNLTASRIVQEEVQTILRDLIFSQNFFLDVLAKALQSSFIRSLQWSFDGKCICIDKTQALAEFGFYIDLNSTNRSGLDCYNQLTSRLQENQFQLATSCYRLPEQIVCYFHPSFNKSTCHANLQLLSPSNQPVINNPRRFLSQGPFYMSQPHFQFSNSQQFIPNRFGNGRMRFGHFDYFSNYNVRSGQHHENVRFKGSPMKPFNVQKQGTARFGIKVVPLSFFHPSEATSVEPNLEADEVTDTEFTDEYSEDLVEEEQAAEEPCPQKPKISMHHKILDLFFNPRREKQNYVSSWLSSCNLEQSPSDVWHSAVLMPGGNKKKLKNVKPTTQHNFAIENSHLVDVFGNAYINWKQLRNRFNETGLSDVESSSFLRFNYSSLYEEESLRDIESSSRKEKQIKSAIDSIKD